MTSEPTIIIAECGCRFKVVSSLPVLVTGTLEPDAVCVPHSHERTKHLEQQANKLECGCAKSHTHTHRGICIEQGCQDCDNCRMGECRHG